jgi:uncharacterized membrane protein
MRWPKPTTAIVIAVLVVGAIIIGWPMIPPSCTTVNGAGDTISVPMAELPNGAVKFFCVHGRAGDLVRFVLARGSDGRLHSVFDACHQCYRFHKGYTVAGGYLICRLCGNRYKLDDMQKGMASCVPVGLHTSVRGDTIEVKPAELEKGRSLF